MPLLKTVLHMFCLFVAAGAAFTTTNAQTLDPALTQRLEAMEGKAKFCMENRDLVVDAQYARAVEDCVYVCASLQQIKARVAYSQIPPAQVQPTLEQAADRCEKVHNILEPLILEKLAALPPSISDKLGLKEPAFKKVVDAGFNRCINEDKAKESSECNCIAEFVVKQINETGSITRPRVVFARSVSSCRGDAPSTRSRADLYR